MSKKTLVELFHNSGCGGLKCLEANEVYYGGECYDSSCPNHLKDEPICRISSEPLTCQIAESNSIISNNEEII